MAIWTIPANLRDQYLRRLFTELPAAQSIADIEAFAVQLRELRLKMVGRKTEPKRETRIIEEIIVDAYTDEERAMSWYYYLDGELRFPFDAKCIKQWPISPLRKGEKIQVIGLAPARHCVHQILVQAQWGGSSLGVPLA